MSRMFAPLRLPPYRWLDLALVSLIFLIFA